MTSNTESATPAPAYSAESSRLSLQPLSVEHLLDYHAIQIAEGSMMWSEKPPHTSITQTLSKIHDSLPTREDRWKARWSIILKDSKTLTQENMVRAEDAKGRKMRMIGMIAMAKEQEIGYKLHPDFWGKGYMSEALTMFLEMFWGMEANKKYDQLFAQADPENTGSVRVLEKAGFVKRGEVVKGTYHRFCAEEGVMSDLRGFALARPKN